MSRPRRTRIYDANYDIGESYYKKQLDELDNKRGGTRFTDQYFPKEERVTPKVSFLHGEDDDNRFKSKLRSKAFFADEDDDVLNTSFKPYTSKYNTSDDSFFAENARDSIFKKVLDAPVRESSFLNNVDDQVQGFTSSRRLKVKTETYSAEGKSDETSSRMKATKARLADLESEMLSIDEKHNEREKRKSNLRKLLNESDSFNALEEM